MKLTISNRFFKFLPPFNPFRMAFIRTILQTRNWKHLKSLYKSDYLLRRWIIPILNSICLDRLFKASLCEWMVNNQLSWRSPTWKSCYLNSKSELLEKVSTKKLCSFKTTSPSWLWALIEFLFFSNCHQISGW